MTPDPETPAVMFVSSGDEMQKRSLTVRPAGS